MTVFHDALADFGHRFGDRLHPTEHRQIELYTRKKKLAFAPDPDPAGPALPSLLGVGTAFLLLDGHLEAVVEAAGDSLDGKPLWQRYLALPRASASDKMIAELYRILRILRTVLVHRSGRLEIREGIINARCTVNRTAVAVHITDIGLDLLQTCVAWYLDSFRQPYGDAYVEAKLGQYYSDIVGEIRRFADEDRILFQYRQRFFFNRHFRFDCDNPKFRHDGDRVLFDIGDIHADPARTPIDLFVVIDNALHIIPVEALTARAIATADLPRWRARTADGLTLPAHFRPRFGRETMVPGLPMW